MVTLNRFPSRLAAALGLSLSLGLVACGDDDSNASDGNLDGGAPDSGSIDSSLGADSTVATPDTGVPNQPGQKAVYAFAIGVASPDGTAMQYVVLRDKLDFNFTLGDLRGGKEFGGYAGIAAIGGHVVVGESETPFATKYKIEENLTWTQVGERLNFSNYITDDGDGLNFYFQAIKGSDMFLYYGPDRTSRVHWNVDQWKILGDYKDTKLPVPPAGSSLGNTGNRAWVRDFKGPVTQSFNVANDETYVPTNTSYIAVYDEVTRAEKAVIEVPCPAIQQVTKDEDGNLYYGTTQPATLLGQLYGAFQPSCLVRVKADGTLDPAFPATDMKAWTGGFPAVNFRYLRDGKALIMVLRTDRLGTTNFTGAVDPVIEQKIAGRWEGDKQLPADATVWEQRLVDVKAGTSKLITGWENTNFTPNYMHTYVIEDRAFLVAQYDPYGDAKDDVYEVDVDTAVVKLVGKIPGSFGNVNRVR